MIRREKIEATASKDLSEILSYASGTFLSTGVKGEFRLKVRGFESQSIALLYDGIPIYEPFFNSFDCKTVIAEDIESIKVVKGASSVLYGPNSLGGVVNIITRRPASPSFSMKTSYDSNKTSLITSTTALHWRHIFFAGSVSLEKSEGFRWNKNGENVLRKNSDYERKNFTGKLYFYPTEKSEVLLETAYYSSEFGIPSATEFYRPRFWRFKNWNRFQLHLGGTFSFLKKGYLKLRSYYVRHDNVLDAYSDEDMSKRRWKSTYNNDSYGIFFLGTFPYSSGNEWRWSFNFRNDTARTQDDVGEEWNEFQHQTYSFGVESHIELNAEWGLIGGVSLDHLRKQSGRTKSSINPIIGIKHHSHEFFDFRLSLAQKSRFPSMKSLYSAQGGNPDLREERGTSYEAGLTYDREIFIQGAVFFNRIHDLIKTIRLPDGSKTSLNIGKADIFGLELEVSKDLRWLNLSFSYTYLDGKNKVEDQPLDLFPKSQLNFFSRLRIAKKLRLSLWGLAISSSVMSAGEHSFKIPGYFLLNAALSKRFSRFVAFFKVENLLNRYYITEPGFPMKARTLSIGAKFATDL